MQNNHLTYFKIENFKKFDSLEVNDIGQFNLIVGDNNVGKTCLLEALLFDENPQQLLDNFYLALTKRGLKFQIEEITRKVGNSSSTELIYPKTNYFKEYIFGNFGDYVGFTLNDRNQTIKIPKILNDFSKFNNGAKFNLLSLNSSVPLSDLKNQLIEINNNKSEEYFNIHWIYNYNENILNFPLISFNDTPLEEETVEIFINLVKEGKKQILINSLKVVSSEILDIDLIGIDNTSSKNNFYISFNNTNEPPIPLNFLGDGFKRIFYIVLKALSLKGKRILIDEIEIGIHYSKMKDFWINLMKVCKELDVQLFSTTHSQECTETYIEASNLLNYNNDIRLIKLEESTNKDKIFASTFAYNQICAGLDSNVELRG